MMAIAAAILGLGLGSGRTVYAQAAPVGVRAAGMGGAFTAVADDATATYWNPGGLAAGAFVGVTFDATGLDGRPVPFAGLATPPFGVSYFRTASPTAGAGRDRNGAVDELPVHHAGATVVQSIGDTGLAVGGTAGVLHADGATTFGADAGVMLSGALGKIGLAVHNLTAPVLGSVRLPRQVRTGISVHVHEEVTLAADFDLTTTPTAVGDWRDAAVGVEVHPHAKAWLRGGFHWNTTGDQAAPIGTVGGSVAVYGLIRADAQASFGSPNGNRSWGIGLSLIY
jgi:hypothetical protein